MCEYREIDTTDKIVSSETLVAPIKKESYLVSVRNRTASWTNLVSNLNKNRFESMLYPLILTEDEKQQLWILVAYAHYNLISPVAFFDFLMEVAIEEKCLYTSFATAEKLRKWPRSPVPRNFQDNFLVFFYLCIRDGARAFSLLNCLDTL